MTFYQFLGQIVKLPVKENISEVDIIYWINQYSNEHHGKFPNTKSSSVKDMKKETWANIENLLINGSRGVKKYKSLKEFMEINCNKYKKENYIKENIIDWNNKYYNKYNYWPTAHSGKIEFTKNENWAELNINLTDRRRNSWNYTGLYDFQVKECGKKEIKSFNDYGKEYMKQCIIDYYKINNRFPTQRDGLINTNINKTWSAFQQYLRACYKNNIEMNNYSGLIGFIKKEIKI